MNDELKPAAWAVMAFGRVQKLVVRADVADESACKWTEHDANAYAAPLYGQAALDATIAAKDAEIAALRADRDSWEQQASDRVDDCLQFIEEAKALRADAERYRKWRADYTGGQITDMLVALADAADPAEVDAAIDAAREAG